jgi:hypothetical protein
MRLRRSTSCFPTSNREASLSLGRLGYCPIESQNIGPCYPSATIQGAQCHNVVIFLSGNCQTAKPMFHTDLYFPSESLRLQPSI